MITYIVDITIVRIIKSLPICCLVWDAGLDGVVPHKLNSSLATNPCEFRGVTPTGSIEHLLCSMG